MITERSTRCALATSCSCGSGVGIATWTYASGLVVKDEWKCEVCGKVLYLWTWESNMQAAVEARAELAGQTPKPQGPKQGSLF